MNEYDEANKDALDVDARKAYMDSISKGLSGDPDASPEAATAIATYGSKNPGSVDFETIPTGPDTKLGRFAQFASDVLSGGSSGEDFTKIRNLVGYGTKKFKINLTRIELFGNSKRKQGDRKA
jgi:hypothetical protein